MIGFFKKYLSQVPYADLFQSLVLVILFLIFLFTVFFICRKPEKYYNEIKDLPLKGDEK